MKSPEEAPEQKNYLERLREIVGQVPAAIQHEFETTDNAWWKCYGSFVSVIPIYVEKANADSLLSPEQYQVALRQIDEVNKVLQQLKVKYPKRADVPPEAEQQELIAKFDAFREL